MPDPMASVPPALTQAGHAPVEVEREFVVFDNAPSVDDGWLGPEGLAL